METSEHINYDRVKKAIVFISSNFKNQPTLDELAKQCQLSPFHLQRIFSDWAGVSPKQFLSYVTLQHAKSALIHFQASLSETAFITGLSGTSRLHDLFIKIEGMTPGEFKNGGENLIIKYRYASTLFGNVLVASTPKGICSLSFIDNKKTALNTLMQSFPNAAFEEHDDEYQQKALLLFRKGNNSNKINLHLKGTAFQLKVWEALLNIAPGQLATYGNIASMIGQSSAARAVGTAVGSNPVAYIIPCHRVIKTSGILGNYMWGSDRKTAMIGMEALWNR